MSSILTNSSAMNALATLKDVNRGLNQTQDRVSTGLKVASGKDNAAYFAVSETMKGDSGMFKAINEGMTATKNSVATARLGAETVSDIAQQIVERVAFAQTDGVDPADVQLEIDALVKNMGTAIAMEAIDVGTSTDLAADLATAEGQLAASITASTSLGITENALDGQMEFIDSLTDTLDSGVSSMVDADMEEEAARLQAYQVQQQLATQSLSIANQAPQNILSLFR